MVACTTKAAPDPWNNELRSCRAVTWLSNLPARWPRPLSIKKEKEKENEKGERQVLKVQFWPTRVGGVERGAAGWAGGLEDMDRSDGPSFEWTGWAVAGRFF